MLPNIGINLVIGKTGNKSHDIENNADSTVLECEQFSEEVKCWIPNIISAKYAKVALYWRDMIS